MSEQPADPRTALCGAFMPGDRLNGPRCDLPFGHDGDHMADDRYIWRGPA